MADMSRKMALQQSGAQNISSGLQGMSDYAANTYGFDPSQGGGGWNPTINFRKKNPQFGKVKYGQINYGQPNPLG